MSPESLLTPTSPDEPYGEAYYSSGNYHDYLTRGPKYAALAEEMTAWLKRNGLPLYGNVLDYGCGVGHLVRGLRRCGVSAFGCDLSRWATRYADMSEVASMDERGAYLLAHVSLLIAFDVFEHMNLADVIGVLDDCDAIFLAIRIPVSKIDGRPYVLPCSERDPTHRLRLTKASWAAVFRAAGYEEVARPALKHWWDSEGVYCALFRRKS